MSRARITSTLVVAAALVVASAGLPAEARSISEAKPKALIPEGYAFIDSNGDSVYDRFVHEPGDIAAKKLIAGETSANSTSWKGYDFSPDLKTLYGVVDDGFVRSLAIIDQTTGRFGSEVGAMTPHAANNHSWTDLTIDPVKGVGYAASVAASGPEETTVYTVNLKTGATTEILTTAGVALIDMSMNCKGQMYGIDIKGDQLVKVDAKTGGITSVGPLGVPIHYAQGIDFDNRTGDLHAWLYDGTAGKTKYSELNLATGKATLFPGGTIDGEYEGAFKTGCPSEKCPKLKKKVKQAKKAVTSASKALKAAQQGGNQTKIAKAKKKLKKAKKKLKKATKAADEGNC